MGVYRGYMGVYRGYTEVYRAHGGFMEITAGLQRGYRYSRKIYRGYGGRWPMGGPIQSTGPPRHRPAQRVPMGTIRVQGGGTHPYGGYTGPAFYRLHRAQDPIGAQPISPLSGPIGAIGPGVEEGRELGVCRGL